MSQIATEFPYESRYVTVHGSRMHYVEEGTGAPILFLHGNPTSSYLWRNIIPHLSDQGRAIAVDLIGMGKSDKPDIDYRFVDHVSYLEGFIDTLGLDDITLVIHDWGSGLGFHYATRHRDKIRGIAFMEAILAPMPGYEAMPEDVRETFRQFRTEGIGWELIGKQNVFVEQVLPGAVARGLSEAEMTHYRAPYLEEAARKPLWRWPNEIPIGGEPADMHELVSTYNAVLQKWDVPKLLLHANPGILIPAPLVEWAKANLPNLKTVDIGTGLHFVQEDNPDGIGRAIAAWRREISPAG